MCVFAMVIDHYTDEWQRRVPFVQQHTHYGWFDPIGLTPDELAEVRRLLDRSREYDRKNAEPDCELDEKKQKLLKLAQELGVKIEFADEALFGVEKNGV